MEIDPNENLVLKIQEDVETRPIEMIVQSSAVPEEEQVFFTEEEDEADEQIRDRKRFSKDGHKVDENVLQIDAISKKQCG